MAVVAVEMRVQRCASSAPCMPGLGGTSSEAEARRAADKDKPATPGETRNGLAGVKTKTHDALHGRPGDAQESGIQECTSSMMAIGMAEVLGAFKCALRACGARI
jgi:hypothetical protein